MGGSGNTEEASKRLGLPAGLVEEAEGFNYDNTIYPDNWQAVIVFKSMLTQWRYGPSGISGLDYNVIPFVMGKKGVDTEDEDDVFESVQIMERAALAKVNNHGQSKRIN